MCLFRLKVVIAAHSALVMNIWNFNSFDYSPCLGWTKFLKCAINDDKAQANLDPNITVEESMILMQQKRVNTQNR